MIKNSNRVALVTGGNRGLGLAITRRLVGAGFKVVVAARTNTAELESLIVKADGYVVFENLDLHDHHALHSWVSAVVKRHGVPYALINNAAVAHDGVLATMHESQIFELISINVISTIILTKYVSRAMLRQRVGRIVNISSIIASTGFNGLSVYAASKAALNGFTKSLARELGKVGITVNTIAPGFMRTDMSSGIDDEKMQQIARRSPLGRLASTDEAASAVEYLLSESASAITGTSITVDAGNTA